MIILGAVSFVIGIALFIGGSGSSLIFDLAFQTHTTLGNSYGHGIVQSFANQVLFSFAGIGLTVCGPLILIYGFYETTRATRLLSAGKRSRAMATFVETETMERTNSQTGETTTLSVYYLNYQYPDEQGEVHLGQVRIEADMDAQQWKNLISSGKSALEVVYNPSAPTEHIALYRDALPCY